MSIYRGSGTPTSGERIATVQEVTDAVDAAEEWANKDEDELVSSAAGGDLVDDYSSKHHAAKASASETAAASSESNASTSEINAAASESAAATSESNAATSESNAATSASNASTSETNAATSASNASTSETNAATSETNAAASAAEASSTLSNSINKPSRNCALNQEPLSQGESTRSGMSATIWSGDSTNPRTIANGLDMATGDNGGLVWIKNRDNTNNHMLFDTVRGGGIRLSSSVTAGDTTNDVNGYLSSFASTGFTVDAGATSDDLVNDSAYDYVAWSFGTTKKTTGTTNRNKAYTCHFNPDMGFSIVGYEGDGVDGHEIPHHLGVAPELSIFKNRTDTVDWHVYSSMFNTDERLKLNGTDALSAPGGIHYITTDATVSSGSINNANGDTDDIISYHFATVEGVSKIGKYIGTGAAGNYVPCGLKPAFLMVKNISSAGTNWVIVDGIRGDIFVEADTSDAEVASDQFDFVDGGFTVIATGQHVNQTNDEYIFIAFAETGTDATKAYTDYPYATSADTLSVENGSLVSVANGFNASGQVDTQYQFGSGITRTYGAGHENKHYYVYTDKTGSLGESEYRPLEGWNSRNECDKWGVESPLDATLRTTAKHSDYESETGVAVASGQDATREAYHAFDKVGAPYAGDDSTWTISTTTNSWLQYKGTEHRILKSWRILGSGVVANDPKRFTIEGSNDGLNWTAIDSTYTSADYTGNGASLWGDLHSTSANTTAYLYHRINITANNGGTDTSITELEFNTILPSDYYLVEEGKMYSSSDVAIERVYLGEFKTDADGDIVLSTLINYPVAKQRIGSADVHGDLKVHGEIQNELAVTGIVKFDGTENPPLIEHSVGCVVDIVDTGTGSYEVVTDGTVDLTKATWHMGPRVANCYINYLSPTRLQVITQNQTFGAYDRPGITVTIIGGKEIL
jgi:hypothetical protein